jgi:predicted homoserine dehydrogenase-like protein
VIIVDTVLKQREQEGKPVTVAMVGAGYMARGIALEIITAMKGMRLVAISNRNVAQAELAYSQAGITAQRAGGSVSAIEQAIAKGRPVVTDDPTLLCKAGGIDAIIEATGDVEIGAQIALEAPKSTLRSGRSSRCTRTAPVSSTRTPTATSPASR